MTTRFAYLRVTGPDATNILDAMTRFVCDPRHFATASGPRPNPAANIRASYSRALGPVGISMLLFEIGNDEYFEMKEHLPALKQHLQLKRPIDEFWIQAGPAQPLKTDPVQSFGKLAHEYNAFTLNITSVDRPRLLQEISGVLDDHGLEIVRHDGLIVDSESSGAPPCYSQAFKVVRKQDLRFASTDGDATARVRDFQVTVTASLAEVLRRPHTISFCKPDHFLGRERELADDNFVYVLLWGPDDGRLLASASDFVCGDLRHGGWTLQHNRSIVRSCARAMGGQAAMILVTRASQIEAASMREMLPTLETRLQMSARIVTSSRSPWSCQHGPGMQRFTVDFQADDRPGLLRDILKIIRTMNERYGDRLNIVEADGIAPVSRGESVPENSSHRFGIVIQSDSGGADPTKALTNGEREGGGEVDATGTEGDPGSEVFNRFHEEAERLAAEYKLEIKVVWVS